MPYVIHVECGRVTKRVKKKKEEKGERKKKRKNAREKNGTRNPSPPFLRTSLIKASNKLYGSHGNRKSEIRGIKMQRGNKLAPVRENKFLD